MIVTSNSFFLFVFLGGEENKKDYQTQTKNPHQPVV